MFSRSRHSRKAKVIALGVVTFGAMGVLLSGSSSCAPSPDAKRFTEILQPDYPTYRDYVDAYVQRRCGTLDCHGQPGRAYRLYGFSGLRLSEADGGLRHDPTGAGIVSGQQATTEDEVQANYQAAVGLEPEEMSRLIATQGADPNRLLLLRKPLRLERHKGGPAMAEDDPGYRCVVAWLRIRTVRRTQDGQDFETIPQEEREQMPAKARPDCATAKDFP